jgi:hypothetical protein
MIGRRCQQRVLIVSSHRESPAAAFCGARACTDRCPREAQHLVAALVQFDPRCAYRPTAICRSVQQGAVPPSGVAGSAESGWYARQYPRRAIRQDLRKTDKTFREQRVPTQTAQHDDQTASGPGIIHALARIGHCRRTLRNTPLTRIVAAVAPSPVFQSCLSPARFGTSAP